MTFGLHFNGRHSSDFGVFWKSEDRSLLPEQRLVRYTVPGRSGNLEIADGWENRIITGTISFFGAMRTLPSLRQQARAVAQWLSGEGELVFDDEPDKQYNARITEGINIGQIAKSGSCFISFDCQPFAESLVYRQQQTMDAVLPHTEAPEIRGTQPSPCLIYVTAKSPITTLTITKISEKK